MDLLSDSDNSDDGHQVPEFEPHPESIHFSFEKNAKSRDRGLLLSHNLHYKWYHQQQYATEDGYNIR